MKEHTIKSLEIRHRIREIQKKLNNELELYHIEAKVHAFTKTQLTDLVNGYYSGVLPKDGVTEKVLHQTHKKHNSEKCILWNHEREIKKYKVLLKMYNRIYSKLE